MKTLEIGRVVKPHGVRGELKVHLHWAESSTLDEVEQVIVRLEGAPDRAITIESTRRVSKFALVKLEGVDSPEQAEALRGAALFVPRNELPALDNDEYYLADLIGATVEGPHGVVGEVIEVRPYPSIDAIVIQRADGRTCEMALLDAWIERVDIAARRLVLSSVDGLIE